MTDALELANSSTTPAHPSFFPEDCPFETVIIDVTHRCNMACHNCYVPNRTIPDLDATWLSGIFARLPRGRFIRLVGGEPTLRRDLTDLIRAVRAHHHHPVVVSNGLKLADREYARSLRRARLRTLYISMNGAFDDDLYRQIDNMACAAAKRQALDHACAERFYLSIGMILVRGINEHAVAEFIAELRTRPAVREIHFRSVAQIGRHIDRKSFTLNELLDIVMEAAGSARGAVELRHESPNAVDFADGESRRIHLTEWPDLGSTVRGRLTPDGMIEPFFEHVIANEGGY